MDMSIIKRYAEVVIQEGYMIKEKIFLRTSCGKLLQYIGKYDFNQLTHKVRFGKPTWIGIDPSATYCAFPDDVAAHQLR